MKNVEFKEFNEMLAQKSSQKKNVNFIQFLTVSDKKKCSIVCEYKKDPGCNSDYYGLHPSFSVERIILAIYEGSFKNETCFNRFIEENVNYFSMHSNHDFYFNAVFSKVVLRMATRFGIKFRVDQEALGIIQEFIQANSSELVENVTFNFFRTEGVINEIAFLGGFSDKLIEALDSSKLSWMYDETKKRFILIIQKDSENRKFSDLRDNELQKEDYELCYGSVYYSGVMPRVVHIDKITSFSNAEIETLKLIVEKTTFATLDAFDNCEINNHPLLVQHSELLSKFEENEDSAQETLFERDAFSDREKARDSINRYLKKSFNTHTVAVSGNIVNSEGYLLVAERNYKSIDGGQLYCSVNGQSEFKDFNVSFYNESVYEDFPTLIADPEIRNDFSNELNRETVAELNLNNLMQNWRYYGISILGIRNMDPTVTSTRRMHFNVLAKNKASENFEEIIQKFELATEKFENNRIYGLKLWFYDSVYDLISYSFKSSISFISEYSYIISYSLGFLYLMLVGDLENVVTEFSSSNLNDLVTLLLAFVVFINALIEIAVKIQLYLRVKKYVSIFKYRKTTNRINGLNQWLNRFKLDKKLHPIMYVMLSLYLLDE